MLQMRYVKLQINFQNKEIIKALKILKTKRVFLFFKRLFDIVISLLALLILSPFFIIISIIIVLTSKGSVFYKQVRIGKNCKPFKILKFRTMVANADKIGTAVTVSHDPRITSIGRFLRKYRIDEFPQFFNVLIGDMSVVGPRPEVEKYVKEYKQEDYIALLVRPGITCSSSIKFANEAEILNNCEDADEVYINKILPDKCMINNKYVLNLSFKNDLKIFLNTAFGKF